MPRTPPLPVTKRHVAIYDEDWDFLDTHYGRYSASQLGISAAIREIVHRRVRELQEVIERAQEEAPQ